MEYRELLVKRESVRSYDPTKPVHREVIERILEAGRLAPSAANRQPWKFIVVTSKELLEKIYRAYERPWFHDAPVVLVVVGKKNEAWVRSYDGYCSVETDAAIAMTAMLYAAANEGVGSCWISNFNPSILREVLHLSDSEEVYAITPLGYPKADYTPKGMKERKPLNDVVQWM
ncbi:MAG: nitroreductase family protein [Bacteroidetes bacterium]|nr:nitroreductase family protein [Bacteroidota bacterium]